jgi:hypothetical protein
MARLQEKYHDFAMLAKYRGVFQVNMIHKSGTAPDNSAKILYGYLALFLFREIVDQCIIRCHLQSQVLKKLPVYQGQIDNSNDYKRNLITTTKITIFKSVCK